MLEKQYKQKGNSTLRNKPINFSIQDSYLVLLNLSKTLYKDSLLSSLRELIVNGLDAIKMLKSEEERKNSYVYISLSNLDSYKENKELNEREPLVLTIKDEGIGMSRQFLETDFVVKGKSNKLGDVSTTGGFGLGFMSLFCLGSLTTIESIHNGEYCKYSVQDTGKTFQIVLLEYKEVDKSVKSGTTLTIILKDKYHNSYSINTISSNIKNLFCTNEKVVCLTDNIKHTKVPKLYETDSYYIVTEKLSSVDVNGILYKESIKGDYNRDKFFIVPKFVQNKDISFSLSRESFDVSFSSIDKLIKTAIDNTEVELESIFRKTRLLKEDDDIVFGIEDLKKLYEFLEQKDLEKTYTIEEISYYFVILKSHKYEKEKVFISLVGSKFNYYHFFKNLYKTVSVKANLQYLYSIKGVLDYTIKLLNFKIVNTSKSEYDNYLKDNDYGRFVFSKIKSESKDIVEIIDFIKEKALTGKDMYKIMKSTATLPKVKYEPNPDIKDIYANKRISYDNLTKDKSVYYIYGTYKESYTCYILTEELVRLLHSNNIKQLSENQSYFSSLTISSVFNMFRDKLGLNVSYFIPIIKESELEVIKTNPNFIHYKDLHKHLDFKPYIEEFLLTARLTKIFLTVRKILKQKVGFTTYKRTHFSFKSMLNYFNSKYPNLTFYKYFLNSYNDISDEYLYGFPNIENTKLLLSLNSENTTQSDFIKENLEKLKEFEEHILKEETISILAILTKVINDLNTPEELDFLINGKK